MTQVTDIVILKYIKLYIYAHKSLDDVNRENLHSSRANSIDTST